MIYHKQKGVAFLVVVLIVFCILVVGVGGYLLFKTNDQTATPSPSSTFSTPTNK